MGWMITREQRPGPCEQVFRRGHVGPAERPLGRAREALARLCRERRLSGRTARAPVFDRFLQVVPEDLVDLRRRLGCSLQPVRVALVQAGTSPGQCSGTRRTR